MKVRAERVRVAEDDLATQLREEDAEVHREQRLADAASPSADRDDTPHARAGPVVHERRQRRKGRYRAFPGHARATLVGRMRDGFEKDRI